VDERSVIHHKPEFWMDGCVVDGTSFIHPTMATLPIDEKLHWSG
jgi:hypothetical protein